ncbi:acetoin utilization protein AcuC [Sporosarcina pasteurii]|uniref:Acetoin utilization protein AcuC n=1 Tax=Sporosarcina pasteurii TaxID=1474 RepID=A0A380C5I4_SPOPA|nr:acetoin utilization protein AcuC [Sporosarcina pasteurii]MDS9471773.1 acetoin utilization protein AcuC [Sporosarcina pasteurii]QBQ04631.1 acetoin utilization protein AcuC [Sporosarcina pasteurii]SUJ13522.1 Acetoin utilization protein AcuC [Sporosarcina pasteurii]
MKKNAVFIFSEDQLSYSFSDEHPFNQKRILLTLDLLKNINAIQAEDIIPPRIATDEEILLVHDEKFVEIVKKAGKGELSPAAGEIYGIGTEDTPIFPNMHEASALLVGGTLTAVDEVMEGRSRHALNLGGGLHHGFKGRASGFCVYNDSSVAIKYMQQKYGARVLYIDTDAHHGDGVQWAFYDDPNVCTLSIHETGRYLFPGTGKITERGNGPGYGTSFNFPIDAFTEDDSFLAIYRAAMMEVTEYFKPDVILTQNGADAHYFDPLTHLYGTMNIYKEIPRIAQEIADEYCDGRWIAVGGGGYDIWRVVPRAWAHLWIAMSGQEQPTGPLPQKWLDRWQKEAPITLIQTWEDPEPLYKPIPRKKEIEEKNAHMLEQALHTIRTNN